MRAEDIREDQYVYFRWKCGICRGVVVGVAHDRVVVNHITRVVEGRIEPIRNAPPALFLPLDDVAPNSWNVPFKG